MNNLVSIVTRTQNRTVLLRRLKDNLSKQRFQDFCWIIVNDGGENYNEIDSIAKDAYASGINVIVKHFSLANGRSKAANIGISAANSKYVMLLDDDDTLSEDCLQKEVEFLENYSSCFDGVICYVNKIEEHIDEEQIIQCASGEIFANDVDALSIGKVFSFNPIMTCGFLYRKAIWSDIGGYPENINYTEDWFFNVQFILRSNIGIIPDVLASVHSRADEDGVYSNTTSNKDKVIEHELTALAWKNELLRRLAHDNNPLLSVLTAATTNRDIQLLRIQQINMSSELKSIFTKLQLVLKYSGISATKNVIKKIYYKFLRRS